MKVIIFLNETFVGKGYFIEEMNKLYVVDNNSKINKNITSIYIVDSYSLWHDILAHTGTNTIKRMVKRGIINYHFDGFNKYEICDKSKMIKKPIKNVERY